MKKKSSSPSMDDKYSNKTFNDQHLPTTRINNINNNIQGNISTKVYSKTKDSNPDELLTVRKHNKLQKLKLQTKIYQLNKFFKTERQIKKNKQMLEQTQRQLKQKELEIKKQKKSMIISRIEQIKRRSKSRKEFVIKSNQEIKDIKHYRQLYKDQIDKKMLQKREYEKWLKLSLEKKKQIINQYTFISLQDKHKKSINDSKGKDRTRHYDLKNSSRYVNQQINQVVKETYQSKRNKLTQMVKKGIQYGNKVYKEKRNAKARARVKTQNDKQQREKHHNQQFQKMMTFQDQLAQLKKPPLQYRGDWQLGSVKEIQKIKRDKGISFTQKIERLNHLTQGYQVYYENGKQQALSLMSAATLARAQLFIKYQQGQKKIYRSLQTLKR